VPDRSQASWPLGGAEVAGSGPVPSSLGQASCRSLGQAPCRARWVRLRAEPLRRAGRSAGHDRCVLTWLSVFCSVLSRLRVFCLRFAPRLNFA
jgi:hypothetical protein